MYHKYFDYIIYHKQCLDGFSSLFVSYLAKTIKKNTIIYPDVPSTTTTPPNITNKNVLIMDVSYSISIFKNIVQSAKSVLFIDHHISNIEDIVDYIKTLNDPRKVKIIYDKSRCGATLTWKYFFPRKTIPLFLKYIEDNDTGTWKYDKTKPFIFSLESNYHMSPYLSNLSKWKKILSKLTVGKMIKEGYVMKKYHDNLVNKNAKKYSLELFPSKKIYDRFGNFFIKVGQYKVAVFCGMGSPSVTSIGNKLLESVDCDFVMVWTLNIDRKEYVISMRSKAVDISEIAKLFGGGGHKLAGAFSFSVNEYSILDLFNEDSLPRN
jgi:uncharacterized protein